MHFYRNNKGINPVCVYRGFELVVWYFIVAVSEVAIREEASPPSEKSHKKVVGETLIPCI